jgi:hypothetical protein
MLIAVRNYTMMFKKTNDVDDESPLTSTMPMIRREVIFLLDNKGCNGYDVM